ncbi:DUF5412 domain-containing protein [Bacillus safensis]|uniref:DUF5412 domain-containing protein n=1 Tax=Bacillus safensis TaxID=561879 RepID=UPI002272172D|nr:DUF5412 domain-containing protein [Bacillus safensis]MCY1117023.1 DUF5412 domain-containing protein [Bacillus safensis]
MLKKKTTITLVILFLSFAGIFYWKCFSLQGVSHGTFIRSMTSPDGTYIINTYRHSGGKLKENAVRAEIENKLTHRKKTIYWKYPDKDPLIKWKNGQLVQIGHEFLNVVKGETYDYRFDRNKRK